MKWKTLRWWLFGTLAYFIFLLTLLPAPYLAGWLAKRAPGVQLDGVTGSVFSGSAADLRYQGALLGAVEWQFDWRALLSLSYGYRLALHSQDANLSGRVDARGGSLYLRDLQGRLPVSVMDRWLPVPSHSLQGSLELHLKDLSFRAGRLASADGEVDLNDGVLSWPRAFTLGSYRMTLSPAQDGGIQAQVGDVASPFKLHAALSFSAQGAYHLVGALSPRDPGDADTRSFLAGLGTPDSTGQYPFDFKGQW